MENRKYVKRKNYKKRKYSKKYIPRNPGSTNAVRYFKLKSDSIVFTSNLLGLVNPVVDNNPNGYPEWTSVASLFDVYKVCAMKIKYFPFAPNDTTATYFYHPMYIVYDPDTTAVLNNSEEAIQYDRCKGVNLYRPFTFYTRVPKVASTGTSTKVFQGGWLDCASPVSVGAIRTIAENLTHSKEYGRILATIYLKAKLRQ